MQNKVDNLNLDNFNQNSSKYPILNSPRSLEACRRQGINPEDLIIKTIEDMKVYFPDKIKDKKHLEQKLAYYEEKRKVKLQLAKEERALIKEQEKQGLIMFDELGNAKYTGMTGSKLHGSKQGNSSLIEREKKQLEKIRFRQQKEIEQMMDYEIKMQEIRQQNEEKMRIDQEREQQRQRELQEKRKKQEELRKQMELERQIRNETEQQRLRQKEIEMEQRDLERQQQEEQKKKEHQLLLLKKEEERKVKQEEFKKSVEQKFEAQQTLILSKKQQMEQKNEIRKKVLEEKNRVRAEQAEQKRLSQERKLKAAKDKSEQELQKIKDEFMKKEMLNEQKRQQFEEERQKRIEENKYQAQKHQEQIAEVLDKMRKLEEEKKMSYLHKIQEAEERKAELDKIAEEENQKKKIEEQEKQQKRIQVKELNNQLLFEKTQNYMNKLNQKEENVTKIQQKRGEELMDKINNDNLKRFDRRDTVDRIQRQQNYQKMVLMEKINDKMLRATSIQEERNQLLLQRQFMRLEIEKQKKLIAIKMEKVKLGKMNPNDIINDFKNSTGSVLFSSSVDNLNKTYPNKSLTESPQNKKRKLIESTREKKVQTQIKPVSVPNDASEKEINKIISELKQRQNVEMLRLLEEEQDNEYKREKMLQEIQDPKEKQKAEKFYQGERSKGQARIQKLTDQHFEEIMKIRRQYAGIQN
ncbi:hypothetical protein ABPG74_008646 [Tetrahymena malaccensis]